MLIALAAAKAGTTTDSVAIRDALRDVANPPGEVVGPGLAGIQKALSLIASGQDINYEGASGPVDFDENGDVSGPMESGQSKATRSSPPEGSNSPSSYPSAQPQGAAPWPPLSIAIQAAAIRHWWSATVPP